MKNLFTRLWHDESALSGIEYGILAAIVAVGLAAAANKLWQKIDAKYTQAAGSVGTPAGHQ
ncbi:MAG: Flp family type IVb pilin [Proteobacteria bacterium]|nr:Flp family type IVb pilin [Pseudomonadota bacterium]